MFFWLLDKVKESNRNEAYRRRYEEERHNAEEARIRINALCKAEVERLAKSPVIDEVYTQIFKAGRCVEKFIVRKEGVDVFYSDSTSVTFHYKSMGIKNLPDNYTTIFDSDRLVLSVNWNDWGSILKDHSYNNPTDSCSYLYFCYPLRRNNVHEREVFPHFDCRLAVGNLLAEKSGLQYNRPYWTKTSCGDTMSYEFSFDTQSKLKSW